MAMPASRRRSNSAGAHHRATGRWRLLGRRYCPRVTMSTPTPRRSARVDSTSPSRSPMPRIIPDLVVRPVTFAVGDEYLDDGPGGPVPNGGDGRGERPRSAVGQVVARHAGDHRVGQVHPLHRLGHPLGLTCIEGKGTAGVDLAEPAGAGAPCAVDHERGRSDRPALVDVRTAGFFADGDEIEVTKAVLEAQIVVGHPGLALG